MLMKIDIPYNEYRLHYENEGKFYLVAHSNNDFDKNC